MTTMLFTTQTEIDALNRLAADTVTMTVLRNCTSAEFFATVLQAEYHAYLCTLCDHDCQCLALTFDEWKATVRV